MSVKDPYRSRRSQKKRENADLPSRKVVEDEGLRDVLPSTELRKLESSKKKEIREQ
jgi:hypothetical protein